MKEIPCVVQAFIKTWMCMELREQVIKKRF